MDEMKLKLKVYKFVDGNELVNSMKKLRKTDLKKYVNFCEQIPISMNITMNILGNWKVVNYSFYYSMNLEITSYCITKYIKEKNWDKVKIGLSKKQYDLLLTLYQIKTEI